MSVSSATINRVSYKNTNNTHTNAQNVYLKPPDAIVNIISAPFGHRMSNYVTTEKGVIGCVYTAST